MEMEVQEKVYGNAGNEYEKTSGSGNTRHGGGCSCDVVEIGE